MARYKLKNRYEVTIYINRSIINDSSVLYLSTLPYYSIRSKIVDCLDDKFCIKIFDCLDILSSEVVIISIGLCVFIISKKWSIVNREYI